MSNDDLPTTMTEVLVMFKPPDLSELCRGQANYVRFRLNPDVTIAIGARVKRPGEELIGDPTELTAGICGCDSPVWLLPDGGSLTQSFKP